MLKADLLITLSTRFAIIIAGLLTSILTARFLGPAGRGSYFFVITFAAIVAQFCTFGLQSSNTYLVAQQEELLGKLTANSFWIALVTGTCFSLIVLLGFLILHKPIPENLGFAIVLVPATLFFMLGTNLLVGINQIKTYNFFQLGGNYLIILAIVCAGLGAASAKGFIAASALGWLVVSIVLFIVLARFSKSSLRFDREIFLKGFKYAMKAYLATLLGLLVLKSNIFLLKKFCSDQTLGYFSIASQINDVLAILPASIGLLLFPTLIRNNTNRWQETQKNLLATSLFMLVTCLLAALLVKPFVLLVFGARFANAIPILLWMLPGAFFLGILTILSQYLAASGFPKQLIYIWFIAFLAVNILSWFLIPAYGGIGAAIALSITYFLLFCMIWLLASNLKKQIEPMLKTSLLETSV